MEIITTRLSKFRSNGYTYLIPIIIIIGKVYARGFDGGKELLEVLCRRGGCALMRTVRKLRICACRTCQVRSGDTAFSTRVARTVGSAAIKATVASACLFETTIQGVSPSTTTLTSCVGDPIVNTIICPI